MVAGQLSISPYEEAGTTAGGGGHVAQVIDDLSFEDYQLLAPLNNSLLNFMARSPAHFKQERDNPTERKTDALRFGTLAHCGVLEEDSIFERYERIPPFEKQIDSKNPRATKRYKEQLAEFKDTISPKIAVTIDEFDRMLGVVRSVKQHANVFIDGRAESVLIWREEETGIWCKARLDYLRWHRDTGTIYDFKTSRDCRDFGRSIANYGYDRQAAFYLRGCQTLGLDVRSFWFVVAETEAPFGVMAAQLDPVTLADGDQQVRQLLLKVNECEAKQDWPSYEPPGSWKKPAWAYKFKPKEAARLTVGGVEVAI